jgi:cytochrome c biogenesis protein CcmG/thiol:disulfide interchange protein DsbE
MTPRPRLATIAAVLTLVLVSCGGDPSVPEPSPEIRAGNATDAPLLPTSADALPTMDPETFRTLLGQLEGTPVLVNFWGSWCPPCWVEMPRLVAAHDEFGDRVQFLGVDIEDSRPEARAFMEEFGMTFPSVFDVPDAIKTDLGYFGQPVTIFFRADGGFDFAYAGPLPERVLRRHLEAIL